MEIMDVLLVAQRIESGDVVLFGDTAATVEKKLIEVIDNPFRESYTYREVAAKAAGILAGRYPEALDLLLESARTYADLERNIDDADPYEPNGITVLKDYGPRCERVTAFLRDLLKRYPGLADADVSAALLAMGA